MNLIEARDAVAFHEAFDGRRWTCFRSGKVCAITYARIQGKQAMIQRFQNSSLLAESLEVQPRLFVSHGVDKGKPERFPGGAELPIELPPPVVEPPARRAQPPRALVAFCRDFPVNPVPLPPFLDICLFAFLLVGLGTHEITLRTRAAS